MHTHYDAEVHTGLLHSRKKIEVTAVCYRNTSPIFPRFSIDTALPRSYRELTFSGTTCKVPYYTIRLDPANRQP